jgi:enamine deaminase RidA (YjgF/YER057c/UK114 family)
MRKHHKSGALWEDKIAYSRAIRTNRTIEVSGTTAVENGEVVHVGDAYGQTIFALEIIKKSIEALGGELKDVVRTRMYVTDISRWEAIGRAHKEYFNGINPVTTMVQVAGLIDANMLIEIEATAILPSSQLNL